jgi:GTP-binding protein LepA
VVTDFYDKLKGSSSGYASASYEPSKYKEGDLVKLEILVAGEPADPFARIIPRVNSFQEGRKMTQRLKELLPRQNFEVPIQAVVGGKVLARETLKAYRKDVTGYLYGGDVTRKRKLLEKQKKGKKKMKKFGKVEIPQKVFLDVMKKED